MTFDVGNPAPGLGQAQKCGSVFVIVCGLFEWKQVGA
jgi:hypothetical protein